MSNGDPPAREPAEHHGTPPGHDPADHGPTDHAPRHLTKRPDHLHAPSIALVILGGVLGVAAREGFVLVVPDVDRVPVVIPLVNLLGAFLLGFLYEGLTRAQPPAQVVGRLKLLVGTGFCGGLTTYSSLATDTAVLFDDSRPEVAVLYALVTVVVGAGATFLGIVAATTVHPRKQVTS
ncbi:fluoride efflux transporter FluC [Nocardioides jishulii]|uniref:Fluoride-specific ion channel FluC n=1 Tax=Nocardioides jishulii TaxID=2575440 RepID=A0A4V6X622_9ACTN|nr:CrcB family protein [Nocardioides jishulii]QCX27826.1 CrcB family protein [Nocardioides jishulii]TKI62633.1 CrcB family protein [Nocardioides jishulii]